MTEHEQHVLAELEAIGSLYVPANAGACTCPTCGCSQKDETERVAHLFFREMPKLQEAIAEFIERFTQGEDPYLGMRASNGVLLTTNLMRMISVGLSAIKAQVQAAREQQAAVH